MSQHSAAIALVNRLKFKHLALLVALDDARNLHQAAEAINVAQPSASRMLGDIEEAFGFLLFERNARGMTPTPLGVVTLAYARRALAELTRFAEDLDVKRRGGHGQLTVGAIMGAAPDLLAMAVAALKTESPLLNVRILGETSDQVVQLLHRREVDLALGRLTSPLQHNDFSFEPLARETLLLVVRSVHPLAQRSRITLRELIDWPWVAQPVTSPARVLFEEELARAGLATPVNLTECASIFATLQLLENYDAVAMLPESVVRDHVRGKLLVALPLEIGKSLSGFGILTRKEEALAEPALRFIDLLRGFSRKLARDDSSRDGDGACDRIRTGSIDVGIAALLQVDEQAAVHQQRGACHITRAVGGKEYHAIGDVLRAAQSAQRNTLFEVGFFGFVGEIFRVQVGRDRAGHHRIAANAVRPQRHRA